MTESRQSRKKKKVLVRDLNSVSLQDLDKNALHVIKGGYVLSCGAEGDYCASLQVVVETNFQSPSELVILGPVVIGAKKATKRLR